MIIGGENIERSLEERVEELEKRMEDLELEKANQRSDVSIRRTSNGFVLKVYGEEIVFGDAQEYANDHEVQSSAVHLLSALAYDYLSQWTGNKHSKKRVFIRVQDNDDGRHKKLMALLKTEELVDKVWAIMEEYDEI